MRNNHPKSIFIAALLLLTASACRPVITVGWGEIAFVVVLILLLLGPPLYRLLRKLVEFQARMRSSKGNKK